jgi:hypothetical protein
LDFVNPSALSFSKDLSISGDEPDMERRAMILPEIFFQNQALRASLKTEL